jgi:hypothetical protein
MAGNPRLLRRRDRRRFRRSAFLCALAGMLLVAPGAAGIPDDLTPPVVTVTIHGTLGNDDGIPKTNGWYRSNVTVNWSYQDPESPVTDSDGCDATTLSSDTPGITLTCWAESDGGRTTIDKTLTIDKTAPSISPVVDRPPDANGWYNRPLTVGFVGADATSGLTPCSSIQYAGPDNSAALATGSCTDKAGNNSAASHPFKYDSTPPSLFAVTAVHGNRSAQLSWRKSSDTQRIEVFRVPGRNGQGESGIYHGTATGFRDSNLVVGRKYEYRVVGVDAAENRATQNLTFVATGALLSPTPGLQIAQNSPPTLAWAPVKRATYYNIQLIHGRRVLSAWPVRPSFRLRRTWLYKGRRYRLRPGVYRWYVWPGYGRISAARYAKRPLGSSSFVVTK